MSPFRVKLYGVSGHVDRYGHYLFLNVIEGIDDISALHKRLYSGILKPHFPLFLQNGYTPHLTVGRFDTPDAYLRASDAVSSLADKFETTVTRISVEVIADNEDSIIEMEINLTQPGNRDSA